MHAEALTGGTVEFDAVVQARECPFLNELGEAALGEIRMVYEKIDAGDYEMLGDLAERLAAAAQQKTGENPEPKPVRESNFEVDAPDTKPAAEKVITDLPDSGAAREREAALLREILDKRTYESELTKHTHLTPDIPAEKEKRPEAPTVVKQPKKPVQVKAKSSVKSASKTPLAAAKLAKPTPDSMLPKTEREPAAVRPLISEAADSSVTVISGANLAEKSSSEFFNEKNNELFAIETDPAPDADSPELQVEISYEEETLVLFNELLDIFHQELESSESNAARILDAETENNAVVHESFEFYAETQTVQKLPETFEEIVQMAAEELPFEEIVVSLAAYLAESHESSPEQAEINSRIEELFDLLPSKDHAPEKLVITPELVDRLVGLLWAVGYQNPHEILKTFVSKHDINFLLESIRYLAQSTAGENREVLIQQLATAAQDNTLSASKKWGELLFGLVVLFEVI